MSNDCPLIDEAHKLIEQIETTDLPPNYEPDWEHYNMILADIRHNYTNCDELYELLSESHPPFGDCDTCPNILNEDGEPCDNKVLAHDIIKNATKEAARQLHHERFAKKRT